MQQQVLPDKGSEGSTVSGLSLGERLLNIFATPGDVFDSLPDAKASTSNWLVPGLIACIVGVVYTLVVFAQPNVQQQLREKQEQALQKVVDSGKMSQSDMDAAQGRLERIGITAMKVAGATMACVMAFVTMFGTAAILRCLAWRPLGSKVEYSRLVEVTGLSGLILSLGTVVQMLLVLITGNMFSSPGPALLIGEFDGQNKLHQALAALNVFTAWYLAVVALGLARLTGTAWWRSALGLFGLWIVFRSGIMAVGWAASGL